MTFPADSNDDEWNLRSFEDRPIWIEIERTFNSHFQRSFFLLVIIQHIFGRERQSLSKWEVVEMYLFMRISVVMVLMVA